MRIRKEYIFGVRDVREDLTLLRRKNIDRALVANNFDENY